jgi:hypothetical protein
LERDSGCGRFATNAESFGGETILTTRIANPLQLQPLTEVRNSLPKSYLKEIAPWSKPRQTFDLEFDSCRSTGARNNMKFRNDWWLKSSVFVALSLFLSAAKADVVYNDTGNDFTFAQAPYSTSDFLSASLTFASPLPDNLSYTSEADALISWSVTDQIDTLDDRNAYIHRANFATNAAGVIVAWDLSVDNYGVSPTPPIVYELWTSNCLQYGCASPKDLRGLPIFEGSGENPLNSNSPGTWGEVSVAAPEPVSVALVVIGLAFLLLGWRTGKSRSGLPGRQESGRPNPKTVRL